MRSPAETLARTVGVGALLIALIAAVTTAWRSGDGQPRRPNAVLQLTTHNRHADSAMADAVREAIVRTSAHTVAQRPTSQRLGQEAQSPAATVRLRVTSVPAASVRAVLGAAASAGVTTAWENATGVRALAVSVSRELSPTRASVISFAPTMQAASPAASMVLRDAGGVLDSMPVAEALVSSRRLRVARLQPPLHADVMRGGQLVAQAGAQIPDARTMRRVRLYAAPGWDGKFVVAALEESGWSIDGAYQIAPTAIVRFGVPSTLDTARYAAAIVLDSGLVSVRTLRALLAQGGGVLIAGNALRDPALRTLVGARIDEDRAAIAGALLTEQPRLGLPAVHLDVAPQATVLEREGRATVVAVMRRDVGRVLVSGYRDSWRWRMEGNDEAAAAHRAWWNALVSAVAFESVTPSGAGIAADGTLHDTSFWPGDAAPLADLAARLGVPESLPLIPTSPSPRDGRSLPSWLLFALAAAALVCEWALRRLRGAA